MVRKGLKRGLSIASDSNHIFRVRRSRVAGNDKWPLKY